MARYTLTTHGGRITRTFWCPDSGGYVHQEAEGRPASLGVQVCEKLYHTGPTLTARADTLVAVIRRERRRERNAERRDGITLADLL